MAVTWASILTRIRHRLVEEGGSSGDDFFVDDRLLEWFNEGMFLQHARIFDNAEKSGRLGEFQHYYLKLFLGTAKFDIFDGQEDYTLASIASDIWKPMALRYMGTLATIVGPDKDRFVKRYPQYGPTKSQPMWSFQIDGSIRLYVNPSVDGKTAPRANIENGGELSYYVDTIPTVTNSPVEEPYNVGPIEYVVAMAMARERTDPSQFWFPKAQMEADKILPPPPPPQVRQ